MKNKKMVATLASLCLIVVAVVAAVVGVLAATQQSITGQFKVKYYAMNVSATLSLSSWGPTLDSTTRTFAKNDGTQDNQVTHTFIASDIASTSSTLTSGVTYDFGWSDNAGAAAHDEVPDATFYGYAVYEIAITNNSGLNSMTVTFSPATGATNSVAKVFVPSTQGTALTISESNTTVSWNPTTGALSTVALTGAGDAINAQTSFTVAGGGTGYIYVVVAIADLDVAIATSSTFETISLGIALASVAAQQQGGNQQQP